MLAGRGVATLAAAFAILLVAAPAGVAATPSPSVPASASASASVVASALPGPQPPGETRSHYLTSVDTGLLARTGSADAIDASAQGMASALVVLDAGSPAGPDGSVRLPDSRVPEQPAAVARAVEAYGKAWTRARGPSLVLVVGVTNYGAFVGGPHGAAWARMVETVADALPGIDVRAGLDAEQEYSTALATLSWVEAYDASGSRPYIDFGSCSCPPLPASPPNGWTTEDVYAVAVGDGRAEVLPEIYATKGGNATEWGRLVAWSEQQHPDLPIRVVGVLTEAGACAGPPKRSCDGIDLAPRPAWAQLTAALGFTVDPGPDLAYLTDISYLPQPGRRHDDPLTSTGAIVGLLVLALAVLSTAVASYLRLGRKPRRRKGKRRS